MRGAQQIRSGRYPAARRSSNHHPTRHGSGVVVARNSVVALQVWAVFVGPVR